MSHEHRPTYRAPSDCPVCNEQLHVTQLGCDQCGTALTGSFASCEFCALNDADRDLLRVFLTSRGNLREVERHLGVSYPTARLRFDDLLRTLGYAPTTDDATGGASASPDAEDLEDDDVADVPRIGSGTPAAASAKSPSTAGESAVDPRLVALQALARGDIDLATAHSVIDGETP